MDHSQQREELIQRVKALQQNLSRFEVDSPDWTDTLAKLNEIQAELTAFQSQARPVKSQKEPPAEPTRRIETARDYFEHVAGDVHIGDTHIHETPSPDEAQKILRDAYLKRLLHDTSQIYLSRIDRKAVKDQDDASLSLSAIYVTLLTDHGRRSALEQLNEHTRLVILGNPGSGKSTFIHFVAG